MAFHLDDAVDLMLFHAVETVALSLLTAAVTFALILFHVWIRFFLISAAFALILSQFLYNRTPIAMMAAMAAIAIPIGPAMAPNDKPSVPIRPVMELIANDILPSISSSGAITAITEPMMPTIVRTCGLRFPSHEANRPKRSTIFSSAGARYPASCAPTVWKATVPIAFIVSIESLN